ncbi:MAG TPA: GNAT family N-acetyltransferase, partial [Candidatus Glassbacteria bacterium]|nr:GNAT family N-acetyltransferase [Candidatus Glassbacteria bacterium]
PRIIPAMTLETPRLFIRPFEDGDRVLLIGMLMDPGFMEYAENGPFTEPGAHRRFDAILHYAERGLGKQALIEKASGILIGYCGIEPFELDGREFLELGYRVMPAFRNRGYASEAAKALAMAHRGSLFAYVEAANAVSIRVLQKAGFDFSREILYHDRPVQLYEYKTK